MSYVEHNCSAPDIWSSGDAAWASGSHDQLPVHVVYLCTASVFHAVLVSMLTLSRHLAVPERSVFHLVAPEEDHGLLSGFKSCFRRTMDSLLQGRQAPQLEYYTLRRTRCVNKAIKDPIQKALMFERFYLHEYLPPTVRRVLFLDADTLVRFSVDVLFRMPMSSPLAAVRGGYPAKDALTIFPTDKRILRAIRNPNLPFFGAGVMVLDLDEWRKGDLTGALERWAARFPWAPDEMVILNLEFQNGTVDLDWRWHVWNLAVGIELPVLCLNQAKILHFSGPYKPWKADKPQWTGINDHIYYAYAPQAECLDLA